MESQKDDKQDIKGEKYESLWVKYWNADPENFIWGIDPNDEVPPVSFFFQCFTFNFFSTVK